MRTKGNRIEPQRQGNGKGNKTITFPTFQVGLVVGCNGGSLTFQLYTEDNTTETFSLKDQEKFDENTMRFKKLEIAAGATVAWYFISKEDLDARV
ncbi:hypothetical protein AB9M92_01940 [Peribacillus frigoritolerans]|uniref:Uncharacterized protein n=1 Tax=Peribacillus simplex TaxID=1478 RepID=A0A9W4L6H2_9BACI|nr:hypothetical protein [Peribacillus simplex]CAH0289484.1 hypothetical protein SRABI133_04189 [Peribacillus simplex]